jgi:trehalose-6-phosphate synthase
MSEAFLVNSYDEERVAEMVLAALHIAPEERQRRMLALHQQVSRTDVFYWAEGFLTALKRAPADEVADDVEP